VEAIGQIQILNAGFDFTGVAPNATLRYSNGIDLYDGCQTAGLIVFPAGWFTKINLIAMQLDTTVHGGACACALTLRINGRDHVLDTITNETSYVYRGGPHVVPPGTMLVANFVGPSGPTIIQQQLTVLYEPVRRVEAATGILL
jgi:hypothetical protein